MRSAIRLKLINEIPDIEGRVYEPHAAGAKTTKPYLIIRQGDESEINTWIGGQTTVEVWPYVDRTTFKEVDELAKKIIVSLDKKIIIEDSGEAFTCIYDDPSGEDYVDEEWNAITRCLKFSVLSFPKQITTDPDPVAGLNNWIDITFPELQLNPSTWMLTDEIPAVYWRFADMKITEQWAAVSWIESTIMGHVLAPTTQGRLKWTKKITEKIAIDGRTYLSDGSPLFFKSISADTQGDYLKVGQIKLIVKYGILIKSEAEILNNASINGAI